MTKKPQTAATNRTRPLDRDGDGRDGGSLPGNQTAPMVVGDGAEAGTDWTRDNDWIELKLLEAGVRDADEKPLTAEIVRGWSDEDARAAEAFTDAMAAEDAYTDDDGDERNADGSPIDLPAVLGGFTLLPRDGAGEVPWTRVDAEILEDLQLMDEGWSGTVETLTLATVKEWSDDQAREAQAYAASIVGLTPERRAPAPDFLQPFLVSKPPADAADAPAKTIPNAKADAARDAMAQQTSPDTVPGSDDAPEASPPQAADAAPEASGDPASSMASVSPPVDEPSPSDTQALAGASEGDGDSDDTFTAEEIAAGRTPVVEQEGEAATSAADAATTIGDDDPLVTVQTETAPIAVRLRELQVLIGARRLYKSDQGYSATYSAPFVDEATVKGWIKAGLALDVPSAGNQGGVRVTAEARSVVSRLRLEQRDEAA